jgi:hypothetical protein
VAADPVDDPLVVSGGVGVADRGVRLGMQDAGAIGEIAAQHDEAERAEMIHLIGGEHGVLPEDDCRDGSRCPSRAEEPGDPFSGFKSSACEYDTPAGSGIQLLGMPPP